MPLSSVLQCKVDELAACTSKLKDALDSGKGDAESLGRKRFQIISSITEIADDNQWLAGFLTAERGTEIELRDKALESRDEAKALLADMQKGRKGVDAYSANQR